MLIEDERISFWQPHERESMTRKKFYKIYKGVEQMPEERREGEKGEMLEKRDGEEVQYFTNWIRKSSIPITISNI
jgi:hypothetical protein